MTDLTITELLMFAVSFFTLTAAAFAFHDHAQQPRTRQFAAGAGFVAGLLGVIFLLVALTRIY